MPYEQGNWAVLPILANKVQLPSSPHTYKDRSEKRFSFRTSEITRGQVCSELHQIPLLLLTQHEGALPYGTDRAAQLVCAQGAAIELGARL